MRDVTTYGGKSQKSSQGQRKLSAVLDVGDDTQQVSSGDDDSDTAGDTADDTAEEKGGRVGDENESGGGDRKQADSVTQADIFGFGSGRAAAAAGTAGGTTGGKKRARRESTMFSKAVLPTTQAIAAGIAGHNVIKYLLSFGRISHYMRYMALVDEITVTKRAEPNPHCANRFCVQKQVGYKRAQTRKFSVTVQDQRKQSMMLSFVDSAPQFAGGGGRRGSMFAEGGGRRGSVAGQRGSVDANALANHVAALAALKAAQDAQG